MLRVAIDLTALLVDYSVDNYLKNLVMHLGHIDRETRYLILVNWEGGLSSTERCAAELRGHSVLVQAETRSIVFAAGRPAGSGDARRRGRDPLSFFLDANFPSGSAIAMGPI